MHAWMRQRVAAFAEKWRWFWGLRPRPDTAADVRGQMGEAVAAQFLRERGWKIVARNWRNGRDELDVVAWDGDILVFAEVRARAAQALVSGYHSVTDRKKRALSRAARAYLRGLSSPPAHFRFDIVEVKVSDGTPPEVLLHTGIPLFPKNFHPARGSGRRA